MEEKTLKTSWKQRAFIFFIAILLLGSTILVYALIVLAGNKSNGMDAETAAKVAELQTQFNTKKDELDKITDELSATYFPTLSTYRDRVKSYNATTANNGGLQHTDLKEGTGTTLTADSADYYAYYIGWCADESVFDSSFDDFSNPTKLKAPISGANLIEGWKQGVAGMKIGGVRELTIPGELAYGDTYEICGGKNSPLKFVVLAMEPGEKYNTTLSEANNLYYQIYSLQTTSK